jgi:5-methylcytosine-specific restriction endonuclease McrA
MPNTASKPIILMAGREFQHCIDALPYRSVVFIRLNSHGVPVYRVAGCNDSEMGSRKALERAFELFRGRCFYCETELSEMTVDHVEPLAAGGTDTLQNLVIACKPCNASKGKKAIELFHPQAGRAWLEQVLRQVEDRLRCASS